MNKTSMLHWFPIVNQLRKEIPIPRTEILMEKDGSEWASMLDGKEIFTPTEINSLKRAAHIIGYPLFMRSDLCSGKHQYEDTCFVPSEDVLMQHVFNIVEANFMCDLWMSALVIREFIDMDYSFKAFKGIPIATERRYFISDGEVVCHHPYWEQNAIEFFGSYSNYHTMVDYAQRQGWRDKLFVHNSESKEEIELLTGYAYKIAKVLEGEWSLDFAKGRDGRYWFIDAATAIQSWHPEDCTAGKKNQQHPKAESSLAP